MGWCTSMPVGSLCWLRTHEDAQPKPRGATVTAARCYRFNASKPGAVSTRRARRSAATVARASGDWASAPSMSANPLKINEETMDKGNHA